MPSGFVTPAAGGGSQPSSKWVNCGVVSAPALAVSGARTLYTTAAGEFLAAIRYGDTVVAPDTAISMEFDIGAWNQFFGWAYGAVGGGPLFMQDGASVGAQHAVKASAYNAGANFVDTTAPPLLAGSLVAALCNYNHSILGANPTWQANHVYAAGVGLIASGHYWEGSAGTSGGTIPDFAAHFGGTVTDGGVTWSDVDLVPTVGSVHVYLHIVTPATP